MPRVSKKTRKTSQNRDIPYPELVVQPKQGDEAYTMAQAESLLGWVELAEDSDKEPLFTDLNGNKIICENNLTNRDLVMGSVNLIKQEVLRGKWKYNGEPIIIGKYGTILNGQHTLIGFVLACQAWELEPEKYPYWEEEEPRLEKLTVFGIDEDDETVNTMDTAKPRTLSDVIFRSETLRGRKKSERKKISRCVDHAIRFTWDRTGIADAFDIRRTHSEAIEFLNNHDHLVGSVEYVIEEDDGANKNLTRYLTPGYLSGLFFLMSVSDTNPKEYLTAERRNEGLLDFGNVDKAEEFWTIFTNGKEGAGARKAFAKLVEEGADTNAAKLALIIKAWNLFLEGKKLTQAAVSPKFKADPDGGSTLVEFPTVGGIDLGVEAKLEDLIDDDGVKEEEPKPKMRRTTRKKATQKKSEGPIEEGSKVLCVEGDNSWPAVVVTVGETLAIVKDDSGTDVEWPLDDMKLA